MVMLKEKLRKENSAMAKANTVRSSARKLNLVAASIRGKSAAAALTQLNFERRRIAQDVKKVLQAAVANAENNHKLDVDKLYVAEAWVGRAFVMKRFHTRGRGRSAGIEKPFSNLTIIVREREDGEKEKMTKKRARGLSKKAEGETKVKSKERAGQSRRSGSVNMGQKVNPIGMRLRINRTWDSRWFASKEYGNLLHEDFKIRAYLEERLGKAASVSKIVIERPAKRRASRSIPRVPASSSARRAPISTSCAPIFRR